MKFSNLNQLTRADKISTYLPYISYDPDRGIYFNRDDTAGFILEISPTPFAGENAITAISSVLDASWPKHTLAQFILYADPNMSGVLDSYKHLRGRRGQFQDETRRFLCDWATGYCNYLMDHRFEGISPEIPVPFRNFRSFVTFKIPCSMKEFENGGHNLDRLCGNRDALIGGLKTCNIASTNVPPQELIRWLYQLWNPNHPHLEGNWWDQDRPIAKQIVSSETEIRRYPRKLRVDGWHVQVKTPSFYAEEPDAYTSNMLVGDIKPANLRQIISPFMLTLNIEIVNVGKNIEQKSNIIMTQQGPLPNIAPKLKRKQSEFTKALGMIEDGKKFIQGFLTLVLFDKNPKRLDRSSSIASNIYEQNRYKLQDEYFYNLPLFIAAQPFGLYQPAIKDLGRMRPADTETFALMAPIQADWKGSPTPTLLYLSRRGQVNTLDLHDSDSNYNMVCCAQSGSGKSFNMNYITTNYLSRGGKSFIIDVGRSYQKLADVLDGQVIEFTSDSGISLNVFGNITYEMIHGGGEEAKELDSTLSMYTRLLAQMSNPTQKVTDDESRILSDVIMRAYANLQPGEIISVDHFVRILEEDQKKIDASGKQVHTAGRLAQRLKAFCADGIYGKWFRGPMNIHFNKPLVVLELEELNQHKELREVALLLIISVIDQTLYFGDRSVPTIVLMDEAWDLLGGANSGAFLETGFRRARKYGGSFIVATQSIFDFFKESVKEVGQAILSNAAWMFLLGQKGEDIRRAVEEKKLSLGEFEKSLMETVHTSPGNYSEIFIRAPSGAFALVRLFVDRKTQLLFSTNPNEVQMISDLRGMGFSLKEAINYTDQMLALRGKGLSLEASLQHLNIAPAAMNTAA